MPRRAAEARGLELLLLALGACGDAHPEREYDEELELWPIPNAGSTGPDPFDRPPDAGRSTDAGGDAAAPRDAGTPDSAPPPPPDLSLQVFDPEQVYLVGTLSEGACYRDAIAPILDPDRASIGFDCDWFSATAMIRPSDGRVL